MKMSGILTPSQMRDAEAASVKLGVSLWELMQNAGRALGREIAERCRKYNAESAAVLCGNGNNGGDGFVCARYLADSGIDVKIYLVCGEPKSELAKKAFELCVGLDVRHVHDDSLRGEKIVVDCIFGTGFHGDLDPYVKMFLTVGKEHGVHCFACDCPSGVNCLSGEVSDGAMDCEETFTFHAAKLGMLISPARIACGKVTVCGIGIPDGWYDMLSDKTVIKAPDSEMAHDAMPQRPEYSHKGTFGRVMLVCGSESYIGAAAISSRAALRSGVGITELCAPKSVIQAIAGTAPECVYTALPCDEQGYITKDALPILLSHAKQCRAVVVGCGIGQTEGTKAVVEGLVKGLDIPLLIDADGINQLAKNIDVLRDKTCEVILTPHIGELARLCGTTVSEAKADRYALAGELSRRYGVTVHSKDATTLTFGREYVYVTNFGCSALAKGGSGDMLAGLTGSMLAQGVPPERACVLGSYIMGVTAEQLCEGSSPMSVTASDIIAEFRHTLMVL